mmetsp:Transcript_87443/g.234165  ORF Transcript_87443/g.234165 Transcript_87443/m.234165 type:complete len:161 (-) Transcript_87443:794-1276(-)
MVSWPPTHPLATQDQGQPTHPTVANQAPAPPPQRGSELGACVALGDSKRHRNPGEQPTKAGNGSQSNAWEAVRCDSGFGVATTPKCLRPTTEMTALGASDDRGRYQGAALDRTDLVHRAGAVRSEAERTGTRPSCAGSGATDEIAATKLTCKIGHRWWAK